MQRYEDITVKFNKREIIVPLYRVGVPEMAPRALLEIWELFKDWRDGK